MQGMLKWMMAALLCVAGAAVSAAPPAPKPVRDRLEASMAITGKVDLDPDGQVIGYAIDRAEQVPEDVRGLVAKNARGWRFVPAADGRSAQVDMSLLVVATRIDEQHYRIELRSAWFGDDLEGARVVSKRVPRPAYPQAVLAEEGTGVAYILMRVGRDGTLLDAAVERVDITTLAGERMSQRWRRLLGAAALGAARESTFTPPGRGLWADEPYWLLRRPYHFRIEGGGGAEAPYGQWETYLPGPQQVVPWVRPTLLADGYDAFLPAGPLQLGSGRALLTPLQGG